MKEGIHPNYQPVVFVDANTGKESFNKRYGGGANITSAKRKTRKAAPVKTEEEA